MTKMNLKYVGNALLMFVLTLSCVSVIAQEAEEEQAITGKELLADCEPGATETLPNQACMKYVFGLVQTVVMLQQMDPSKKLFCIDPTVVSLEAVTNGVTTWLKAVPDRLDEEAYVLVSEALNTSYPCPTNEVI